jgi:uncharacterized protein YjbJ (UPF0337 family)
MVHTPKIDMSKIDSEKVKDSAVVTAAALVGAGSNAAHTAKDAAFQAKDWAEPRVDAFLDWLRPRAERAWSDSVRAAAPRVEKAADRATPIIDTAHDRIVDEYLPRLVVAFNSAADRAGVAAKAAEKAALKAQRRSRRRKGFLWVFLGGLAAAVGYTFWRRAQPQNDPWAEPWEQATAPDYDGVARDAKHAVGDAAEAVGEAAGAAVARGREVREQAAERVTEAVDKARETTRKAASSRRPGAKNAEQAPGETVTTGGDVPAESTDAVVDVAEETKHEQ